jgi:hypothetical protein
MPIRRAVRSMSTFGSNLVGGIIKAVLTTAALGLVVVSIMHYMGLPVPSAHELLRAVHLRVF